jgi:hypothetical protein
MQELVFSLCPVKAPVRPRFASSGRDNGQPQLCSALIPVDSVC